MGTALRALLATKSHLAPQRQYLIALHGSGILRQDTSTATSTLQPAAYQENRLMSFRCQSRGCGIPCTDEGGVGGVYTIDDIIASRASDNANELKRATPTGWKYAPATWWHHSRLVSDRRHCKRSCQRSAKWLARSLLPSTVIVMGPGVKPQTIDEKNRRRGALLPPFAGFFASVRPERHPFLPSDSGGIITDQSRSAPDDA